MPTEFRVWQIRNDRLERIPQAALDLEARLEQWLRQDIGIVQDDLLVVGQQVPTAHGGIIDLLAMDPAGNLVILELKRDKTPRDIVAQVLDYASWIEELGHDEIQEIADNYLGVASLEQAFREKFDSDLPEVLNERHRMYVVAASLDSATERIVRYLSETHDVDINVATFAYFSTSGGEFLGRSLLLDEDEVQQRVVTKSKRRPARTLDEFADLAERRGVGPLFERAVAALRPLVDGVDRSLSTVSFVGYMGENRSRNSLMSIWVEESSAEHGLLAAVHRDRLAAYYPLTEHHTAEIDNILVEPAPDKWTWNPGSTWWINAERVERLVNVLTDARGDAS